MRTPMEALDAACAALNGQKALADALTAIGPTSVSSPSISGWRERESIPEERCWPIEVATGGVVLAEELRPDLRWIRNKAGEVTAYETPITPTARARDPGRQAPRRIRTRKPDSLRAGT